MQRTIRVDEKLVVVNRHTIAKIESLIVNLSSSKGTMDKLITGYGWAQNLRALTRSGIIHSEFHNEIDYILEHLKNVEYRDEVFIEEWNEYALKSQKVISYLSAIV